MDYHSILEQLPSPVCVFLDSGKIVYANRSFRECCAAAGALAGRNIFGLDFDGAGRLRGRLAGLTAACAETTFAGTADGWTWKCRAVFTPSGAPREYQLSGFGASVPAVPDDADRAALFRDIMRLFGDGFVAVDSAWRIVAVEGNSPRRCGFDPDDVRKLLGRVLWEAFPQLDRLTLKETLLAAMAGGKPVHFQTEGFLSGRWLDVSIQPSRDGLSIYWRDDSERRKIEDALRENEANLAALLEGTRDLIWSVDREGKLVTANTSLRRLFLQVHGIKLERGVNVMEYVAAERLGDWQHLFERALEGKSAVKEQRFDFVGMHFDGEISCRPVKGRGGEITGVSFLVRDISVRTRAKLELQENEERFRTFASLAPAGMFMADASGGYRYVNNRWCRLAGLDQRGAEGSGWENSVHPGDREEVAASWRAAVEAGGSWEREYRMRGGDGSGVWVLGQAVPLHGELGTISGYAGVIMDISGRKRLEELEQAHRDLYQNLFRASNAVMLLIDPDTGAVIDANPAACRFYGYAAGELVRLDLGGLSGLPSPEALRLLKGNDQGALLRQARANGELRDMEFRSTAAVIQGRAVLYAIATDVTERRRLGEKIYELNQFNRAIIEGAGVGIAVCDKEFRYVFWNRFMEKMTGIPAQDAMGKTPWDVFSFEGTGAAAITGMHERVLGGETVELPDIRYRVPSAGKTGWFSGVFAPHRNSSCAVAGVTAMLTEISGRKMIERSIEQSERRFREVLEDIHMGAVMLDAAGRITFCNDYLLQLTGYHRSEVLGRSWPELFVPAGKRGRWKELFAGVLKDNKTLFVELNEILARDGRRLFMSWNDTIIRDERGAAAGVTSIGIDVTEKVRAEHALRESEQKLRGFIEQTVDGIALVDGTGAITEWNRAASVITGRPRDHMLARPLWDAYFDVLPEEARTPETYREIKTYIEQFLKGLDGPETRKLRELEIEPVPGQRRTVQNLLFPIVCGDSRTLCSVTRDVTELNRTRDALAQAETRYTVVADTIGLGITFMTTDMRVLRMNRQMEIWNPGADLSDRPLCYRAFHRPPKEKPCDGCPVEKTLADGEIHEGISEVKTGGGARYYRIISSPVKDREGRTAMIIEIVEDVTEKRRIEEELAVYQDKLRSATAELSIVEERERRKIAVYLHDNIGQSLTVARLRLSEVLATQSLPAGSAEKLREIQQYLMQSLQNSRSLTYELSLPILYELGLAAALDWLADDFQSHYGLTISVRNSGVAADPDNEVRVILFRVARELLMNVVKHAGVAAAEITVETRDDRMILTVEDHGNGFDGAALHSRVQSGSGFGLFSVREQIAYLGGSMAVDAAPGAGARITVISPLKYKGGRGGI